MDVQTKLKLYEEWVKSGWGNGKELAEDDPFVIEVELTEAYEDSLTVTEGSEYEDSSDEEEVVERVVPVSHLIADDYMTQLDTYVNRSNHDFPANVIALGESFFAAIRHHRSRQKPTRQQVMTSFFNTPSST